MPNTPDSSDIHAAAEASNAAAVAAFLAADRRLVHAKDRWENTPLHHAADVEVARLLLNHGADVNARGWMGATPLHDAAQHGRADVVELLIGCGGDVRARRTERQDTPLHWAATEAVARLLVDHGVDVGARDCFGRTPLHWAAGSGHAGVVRYLLRCGVPVDERSSAGAVALAGEAPLHEAAGGGHAGVVEALLGNGADVNALNGDGQTPLHKAAFHGKHDVVERLVRAGADLHVRDRSGQTPLHAAHRQETTDLLLGLMGPQQPADVPLADPPARLGLAVWKVYMHPSSREAVTVSRNAVLTRWALGGPGQPPRMLTGLQTRHPWVTDVAVLPDADEFLAVMPGGVEVRRWDDLRAVRAFEPQGDGWQSPKAVAVSPDGRWVAVADRPEQLLVLERATGRVADRVEAGERTMCVRFSPDSRLLATACSFQGGGYVRVDAVGADGRLTPQAELGRSVHDTPPRRFVDTLARVAFGPDGRHLALFETSAVCHDARPRGWRGDVVLYDLHAGLELWSASVDAAVTGDERGLADAGYAMGFDTDVVFAGAGVVACGATRGTVLFYVVPDGSLLRRSAVHASAAVNALEYDGAAGLVWAGLEDGELASISVTAGASEEAEDE